MHWIASSCDESSASLLISTGISGMCKIGGEWRNWNVGKAMSLDGTQWKWRKKYYYCKWIEYNRGRVKEMGILKWSRHTEEVWRSWNVGEVRWCTAKMEKIYHYCKWMEHNGGVKETGILKWSRWTGVCGTDKLEWTKDWNIGGVMSPDSIQRKWRNYCGKWTECNKGDGDLVDRARWEETIPDNELEWMRKWRDGGINVGRPKQSIRLCKHWERIGNENWQFKVSERYGVSGHIMVVCENCVCTGAPYCPPWPW